ncbi:helix-turn-helix transcriptional regulator, partial [Leptospira sp. SA-E8]
MAANGGVRAARLRALKADVQTRLTEGSSGREGALSLDALSRRHGISPRYIRQLFAGEETTLTDYVQAQRLALAYRMLRDPRLAGQSIGAIAYDCGFSDQSYFNRCFRRRFGMAPGEARAAGGGWGGEGEYGERRCFLP